MEVGSFRILFSIRWIEVYNGTVKDYIGRIMIYEAWSEGIYPNQNEEKNPSSERKAQGNINCTLFKVWLQLNYKLTKKTHRSIMY